MATAQPKMPLPAATEPAAAASVPRLREDIIMTPGPRRADGSPGWVLDDPAANVFYDIGWREFEMLSRWHLGSLEAIATAVCEETTLTIGAEAVAQLSQFLTVNGLVRQPSAKILEMRKRSRKIGAMGWISQFTGNVLFRKIPLLSPEPFLNRTAWIVRPMFSRGFLGVVGMLLVLALYLTGRQWGQFTAGFDRLYSLEGALGVALALTLAKSIHELSHAYAARLNGAEVPSMGVSLIMFWPVLYTETSAAWRLQDRGKRLQIAIAGVAAELVLAVLALLVWPFLDPGWLRDTTQFAATSLVILSLAINANPLMRFDGYFAVCDLTGQENLQPRSLALLGWAFRRVMAGARDASPEPGLTRRGHAAMLAFGAALGLYRVSLYSGIAYGLSAWVFPALGLALAVLVIVCFLGWPVAREMVRWFKIAGKRLGPVIGPLRVGLVLGIMALPFVVPWRTTLMVPVVLRLGEAHAVFAPEPGAIVRVLAQEGQQVWPGDPLVELMSPELAHKLDADHVREARLTLLLDQHLTGSSYQESEQVEREEIHRLRVEIAGLTARLAKLTLRAPTSGIVRDVEPGLKPGTWLREDRPLLRVVASETITAEAYIEERDLALVAADAAGSLWLDGLPLGRYPFRVRRLYDQAIARIDAPIIAGPGGGPILVKQSADRNWVPEAATYKAELDISDKVNRVSGESIETRAFANIETPPRNLIGRIWDRVVGVWRREIG